MDLTHCPCSGSTLPRLLHPALLALLAEGPAHGYALIQKLENHPVVKGQPPDASGVYRMLRDMEERGLLASKWSTPDTGPARRRFTLTAEGRSCLERWLETLKRYEEALARMRAHLKGALEK